MADFKQINEARKSLGLDEYVTLKELRSAYKKLVLKYHPDRCLDSKKKGCEKIFKKISRANDILMNYCAGYKYSFKEKDVKRNAMEKEDYQHLKRFYDGWLGDLDL
jgi:DnaJ-class molecular chaperone